MKKLSKTNKVKDEIDKRECQAGHFIKRVRQRLGVIITDEQYEHLVSCIKNTKETSLCQLKYLRNQSQRLMVFEMIFTGCEPMNVIYDCHRKAIVTVLFQSDDTEINHYYDVHNNKIMVKHNLGYNKMWAIRDNMLAIPNETINFINGIWEVISEGILQGKRFKLDNDDLIEVM
jgi:hypothetical protein